MIKRRRKLQPGFTLLEVLLAVSIFAMLISALYTTFRVGLRAYDIGEKEIDQMQHARVIFDTMSRDLRSVYYQAETSYNNNLRRMLAQ
nr:prepilin-type N-terminal cleavage/methylation domain-containing protein [Candidatus Sumerlaeota bacterium]